MPQKLLGTNTLLLGPTGVGKTTSILTLQQIPEIKRIYCLFTEPRYDVLGGQFLDSIYWRYVPPATQPWGSLIKAGKQVQTMDNEALQKLKRPDAAMHGQFISLLEQCNNFVDQNDKPHGDVCEFGTDTVFLIDGLTGINKMAKGLAAGSKAILSQPDWGVSMNAVQNFIDKLTCDTQCHFILVGHIEKEADEVSGGLKNMVSTLGRKLAPLIPPNFSDVILAVKEGTSFYWDTTALGIDLKSSNLPLKSKQLPSFKPLLEGWKAKGGVFEP